MRELIIDNFAGGGGASTGIEMAIGRSVDVAINHDPNAIAMHKVNHPTTRHYCEDVFQVDPHEATRGLPVALCWFSPDCKHFSKAKGSTPVSKKIRGLAWVAVKWAKAVKPRVIILENVEEFRTWGPLIETEKGLFPDPAHKGETFEEFKYELEKCGYIVEFKELRACDYGAPTTRKRLFLIARSDGKLIVFPEATHAPKDTLEVLSGLKLPYHSAAECIDWNIPGQSIFDRKKPLAENTMKRIARGLQKFVIHNPNPFIVRIGQTGFGGDRLSYSLEQSLTTITTKAEHCLVTPTIMVNTSGHPGSSVTEPLKTITTGGHQALIQTSWIKEDYSKSTGTDISKPVGTITAQSVHQGVMSAFLCKHYGGNYQGAGIDVRNPTDTITQVDHHALVEAFLIKYYGSDTGQSLNDPLHTIPTKDRFGLVRIENQDYRIVDITMRMLQPHELSKAQGLPEDYIIDRDPEGNKVSKAVQTARIGNMVVPQCAEALVRANLPELCQTTQNSN
ncbi:DNA cytosine methyltransferase [Lactococcus allomyrinae]|uniref:DNA (cytosine-5-)-methyltransferase n=1 Tax=Lactococcus allomyrinae TaxID=2419773 RepID=A0A387BCP4_9LACT|nr:DNA cytosine methyltransferase [Lactococcus allomyrinae]AYF99781.1 DNA cytosine methyltransferase [Lactococcus allomyrinae]